MSRTQTEDFDTLVLTYTPQYIDAFMEECNVNETIEDWTLETGQHLFSHGEIYAPLRMPIHVAGSAANMFAIDGSAPDWYQGLHAAVSDMAKATGVLVSASDVLNLVDVRGTPVNAEMSFAELSGISSLYVTVNGVRSIDTPPSKSAGFGCAVKTPVKFSPEKDNLLHHYIDDLCMTMGEMCVATLSKANTMLEVNKLLCDKEDPNGLSKKVTQFILNSANVAELGAFGEVVQIYSDQKVKDALRDNHIGIADVASDMCDVVLDEIARCIQTHNTTVDAWYQGRALSSSKKPSASRTIFGPGSDNITSRIEGALQEYPSAAALHHKIVGDALSNNDTLGCSLVKALKHTRRDNLDRRRRRRRPAKNSQSDAAMESSVTMPVASSSHHGTYSKLVSGKDLCEVYRIAHRMQGLPAHPGALGQAAVAVATKAAVRANVPAQETFAVVATAAAPVAKTEVPSLEPFARKQPVAAAAPAAAPVTAKTEVPSLELFVGRKQPVAAPVKTTPVAAKAEVPSLEPLATVVVTKQQQPVAAKAEVPSLEPFATKKQPAAVPKAEVPSLETIAARRVSEPVGLPAIPVAKAAPSLPTASTGLPTIGSVLSAYAPRGPGANRPLQVK